ncbi:MAG: hypothetical protein EGP78_12120 [Alistipes shahii]|nr:hypothetical protein [Alistipes shahii]
MGRHLKSVQAGKPDKQQADMTPKEEKWLAEYRRREAAKTVRMQRRALWFWGALFTAWAIFGLFAEPDKFTFTDSLLLMMIVINAGMAIRELIRNKRIAAGRDAEEPVSGDSATE